MMIARSVVFLTVLTGAASLSPEDDAKQKQKAKPGDVKKSKAVDAFDGLSIAGNATDVFAPESGFRIAGWNSWGGANKLVELVPDGTEVKQGQQIARFDFQAKDALSWINEKIAKAEARAQQRKIETQQTVDGLRLDERRKELQARLAQINVEKERALSKRQADIYKIARDIAEFEVMALDKRLQSAEREHVAETDYQSLVVKRSKSDLERYKWYERRYVLSAPHDGVVRHSFNPRERRKVQKGDSVDSGVRVVSVARDASLAARFFVPEHRFHELKVGSEVIVTTAESAQEHRARVVHIEYFPQELGFLLENNSLPNAREKAFAVKAEFIETPKGMTAGTELVVKPISADKSAPVGRGPEPPTRQTAAEVKP